MRKFSFQGFQWYQLIWPLSLNEFNFQFAMTIKKSQDQSFVSGLNLENPCFSHGQLYVACSRVGKPSALFVLAPNNKRKQKNVYQEVLDARE